MIKFEPAVTLFLNELVFLEPETYVIGGAVRNALLGVELTDIDVSTKLRPQQLIEHFQGEIMDTKGLMFGNVKILVGDQWLSITTFRKDVYDFKSRFPIQIEFMDTLEEDLNRRDFTVNTICFHVMRGLVDLKNGQRDLDRFLLVTVKEADVSFREDPLRMLRGIRFMCEYDFDLSDDCLNAIKMYHSNISMVSKRIVELEHHEIVRSPYYMDKRKQYPALFRWFEL